jgi:hypothetical protein
MSRCATHEASSLTFKDLERLAVHYGVAPSTDRVVLLRGVSLLVGDGDEGFADMVVASQSDCPRGNDHMQDFVEACEETGVDFRLVSKRDRPRV